jgi:hypothetical protein
MKIQFLWDDTSPNGKELPPFWKILLRPYSVSWHFSGECLYPKVGGGKPLHIGNYECLPVDKASHSAWISFNTAVRTTKLANPSTFTYVPVLSYVCNPVWTSRLQEGQTGTPENVRVSGSIQSTCRLFVLPLKISGCRKTFTIGKWNPALHPVNILRNYDF